MKFRLYTSVALLFFLFAPLVVRAELSRQERDTAMSMITGTLYLRLDVPCKYGRGRFRASVDSLLEVSPTGYDVERKLNLPNQKKRDSVYWGFFPNDAVRYGKLLFHDESVQVWLEGVSPNDNEIMIDFIDIKSMDDFTKAFNQTFSKIPLQDDHQEWPAVVRKAVAEHTLVVGMTKEQSFCVVGRPINVMTWEENGAKVETWFPRQDKGTVVTFRRDKSTRTGFPALLKFADGKLQVIEQTPRVPDLRGQ